MLAGYFFTTYIGLFGVEKQNITSDSDVNWM